MMHHDSLEPAAIQFTLERLQESSQAIRIFSQVAIMVKGELSPSLCYCVWRTVYILPSHFIVNSGLA